MSDMRKQAGEGVSLASKALGYIWPGAQAVSDVIEWYKSRRIEKQVERLRRFVSAVDTRLACLERKLTSQEVDLFEEILESAVREEDDAKSVYYAALVQYYMTQEVDAPIVRLLANSLKTLSAWELEAFKRGQKRFSPSDVLGQSMLIRLEGLGLYDGKQTRPRKVTPLGKKLREVIDLADETGAAAP